MKDFVEIAVLDLSGFSRYTRVEGDSRASYVARSLEDHIRYATRGRAEVVKTLGDGALLVGDRGSELSRVTDDAIAAWRFAEEVPLRGIVASGPVVRTDADVYGYMVNAAFRALARVPEGRCRTLAVPLA